MKNKTTKIAALLAVISIALLAFGNTNDTCSTTQYWELATTTNSIIIPNFKFEEIMTISNKPYIQIDGGFTIVVVTDAEWELLAQNYQDELRTNTITFYK